MLQRFIELTKRRIAVAGDRDGSLIVMFFDGNAEDYEQVIIGEQIESVTLGRFKEYLKKTYNVEVDGPVEDTDCGIDLSDDKLDYVIIGAFGA